MDDVVHHIPPDFVMTIPLSQSSSVEDFIQWTPIKDGSFLDKSAYHILTKGHNMALFSLFSWKQLWKVRVPFKYKLPVWNYVHSILVKIIRHTRYLHPRVFLWQLVLHITFSPQI